MVRMTKAVSSILGLWAGIGLLAGCSLWDSSSDTGSGDTGGTGGDDGPDANLPGHRVTCCFSANFRPPGGGSEQHYGCQANWSVKECLDPATYGTTPQDLQNFCEKKCQGHPWDPLPPVPIWNWYDINGNQASGPPSGSDMLGCVAIPAGTLLESHIETGDENSCNPFEPKSYGDFFDVPPTLETDFTSSSSQNQLEVWITGNEVSLNAWDLKTLYVLDSCEENGSNVVCRVLFSGFELSMAMLTADIYRVSDITLALNETVAAEAVFVPYGRDPGYWLGTFEFSETEGNPLGTNLFWTQTNTQTNSVDEGALHLTNGPGGLGGVDEIYGVIDITPYQASLRLIGYGQDALGGEWASLDFDMTGAAVPLGGH
jgi:hypothetical protein